MNRAVIYMLLLPLAGAAINILAGWKLPRRAVEAVACASIGGAFVSAAAVFSWLHEPVTVTVYDWLSVSWFSAPASFYLDPLSAKMALMVTGVSFLIHLYSVGYMRGDEGCARFFALLNLFVFSMLLLVMAANLPLMFVGWEGVGFCSYALIGFWYRDPANADAGRKAFVVTRVGDVAFGVALVWLFYFSGTTSITGINSAAAAMMPAGTATAVGLLLLAGASGKSAQLPLTVWLPDAMAGPTPVSALIHAATMVTAGVYLLMRLFPVIAVSPAALAATAAVGALTAFYAATAALAQRDIKKVLAYSTISQIGYMVLAVGAGAPGAALYHLLVHAFFKALLFMAAGCVIQAMREEHDIFRMGGLYKNMPVVFWSFLAGALALSAAPLTGGFFSKDMVLSSVLAKGGVYHTSLWALAELTALLTTIYILRVVYLVFLGRPQEEPIRIPRLMTWTLLPLAALALGAGLLRPGAEAGPGLFTEGAAVAVFAAGAFLAHYLYRINREWRRGQAARFSGVLEFFHNAWYLDRLYYAVLVRPFGIAARFLWNSVDEGAIDGALDGAGACMAGAATSLRAMVNGRASSYIAATVAGAAAVLVYFAWGALR